MKKILFTISILGVQFCHAQWTALNSTTIVQLNDVDFINENFGVIVGDANTILLTSDGGLTWGDINYHNISGDVTNVKLLNADTIYVSTYDWSTPVANVYRTWNRGLSWTLVGTDNTTNHRMDLEYNEPSQDLYVSGSNLIRTADNAATYDTLLTGTAGITSADLLRFADANTGHLSGNISGWITYSAYFFRTENGSSWYPGNAASFPNSDALTTMAFSDPDTAYIFMNQYAGFAPSATNRLVRAVNFNLSIPSPGDTSYTFSSTMVNPSMPDLINDARFEDNMNGLALGNTGKVYRTTNGGTTWTVDHNTGCSTCPLLKMDFANGTGYAVGGNGTLIKYALATSVNSLSGSKATRIFPNPATSSLTIASEDSDVNECIIRDLSGKEILVAGTNSFPYSIDVAKLPAGSYILELKSRSGKASAFHKWLKM